MNNIQVFGEILRVSRDQNRPEQCFADVLDVNNHTKHSPPEFTLIAFRKTADELMNCQIGDLVPVAGFITFGSKLQQYKISVTNLQRLVFDGDEEPQEQDANPGETHVRETQTAPPATKCL